MPYPIPCPKCQTTDYIRLERIIQANELSIAYYCGRCDFNWSVRKTEPPPEPPPLPKPRTHRIGPKR